MPAGGEACPRWLKPQQTIEPDDSTAHECEPPVAIATTHDEAAAGAEDVAKRVAAFALSEAPPEPVDCERVATGLSALGFFVEALQQPEAWRAGFVFGLEQGVFAARLAPSSAPVPGTGTEGIAGEEGGDEDGAGIGTAIDARGQ